MRAANVPMRAMLSLPVATPAGKRLMLAYVVGRKSGRIYRQPLSYVQEDQTLLTPGGGQWKLNLQNGEPVRLRIRGRDRLARPELVRDQAEVEALIGVIAAGNPMAGRFIAIPKGPDGRLDPEHLVPDISWRAPSRRPPLRRRADGQAPRPAAGRPRSHRAVTHRTSPA